MATPTKDFSLTFGYWLVSHKQTLWTWWAVSLMAVIAGSLLWSLWFFSVFFSQDSATGAHLLDTANGVASFRVANIQPTALTAAEDTIIVRDAKHVDLVAIVNNSNTQWGVASGTAHFVVDGKTLSAVSFFLNPGASRPVMDLHAAAEVTATSTVELVFDETHWARSSAGALPEPHFTIAHQVADESTVTIDGQSRLSVTLRADVTNTSVYNFYRVDVPFVAYSGTRIVGVASLGVDRWATLTLKPLSVTLTNPVTNVTKIDVIPQVSRFDAGNTYR